MPIKKKKLRLSTKKHQNFFIVIILIESKTKMSYMESFLLSQRTLNICDLFLIRAY